MREPVACVKCGKDFVPARPYNGHSRCCPACRAPRYSLAERRKCKSCGAEFARKGKRGPNGEHCTDACRREYAYKLIASRRPAKPLAKCEACGERFASHRPTARRFCDNSCRWAAHGKPMREKKLGRVIPSRKPSPVCKGCGKTFKPKESGRRSYCTRPCYFANLATATPRANGGPGGDCHRRRCKRYGVVYEPVRTRRVFERDGWRCGICGKPTPEALRGMMHPDAPQLDHIVPLSRGGAHSYANVRCACRGCNAAKGARVAA